MKSKTISAAHLPTHFGRRKLGAAAAAIIFDVSCRSILLSSRSRSILPDPRARRCGSLERRATARSHLVVRVFGWQIVTPVHRQAPAARVRVRALLDSDYR